MAPPALILLPIAVLGMVALASVRSSVRSSVKSSVLSVWPVRGGTRIVPERGADSFGASREGGKRLHAGVDLLTSKGSAIVAIAEGRIAGFPTGYVGLDAIAIEHAPPLVGVAGNPISGILYAEFTRDPKLVVGETVKAGQVLGVAAASAYGSMLHLEFWQGRLPSAFTAWLAGSPRPVGLLDPTFDLQRLAGEDR